MRRFSYVLIAALAALLLVIGLAACGSSGDSSSSSTEATPPTQTNGKPDHASSGGEGKSGGEGQGSSKGSGATGSGSFTPKQHSDSGGGSEQFRVKGGDNSVQEFGEEADGSELDAAATALHDFLDARAAGDWAAACSYMSKRTIESLEQLGAHVKGNESQSCGSILGKLTNPDAMQLLKAEAAKADVGSLRREGERAFVIYTGLEDTVFAIPMAEEGGVWKVASLSGVPLS